VYHFPLADGFFGNAVHASIVTENKRGLIGRREKRADFSVTVRARSPLLDIIVFLTMFFDTSKA
jgi:hypothetical protein